MKTFKSLLICFALLGCGSEDDGKEPTPIPTVLPTPKPTPTQEPEPAPTPKSIPTATKTTTTPKVTPTKEPEPDEDYVVTYNFQYSSREAGGQNELCESDIVSLLSEDMLVNSPSSWWKCGDKILDYNPKVWEVWVRQAQVKIWMTEEEFERLTAKSSCTVTGSKTMSCSISDNYIEVYADRVDNMDESCIGRNSSTCYLGHRIYLSVAWKVYYWPF